MMPIIFLLTIVVAMSVAAGSTYELLTESRPEGLDYFFAAISWALLLLIGANIDKFFKDYSSCFPT